MAVLALTITRLRYIPESGKPTSCEVTLLAEVRAPSPVSLAASRISAKRVLDLALVVVGLPALAILSLILIPLIRLDSRGPAIFQQLRIGRHGETINIFKFRTLVIGNPEVPTHEMSPSAVTRVGRVLRSTKLDELPQLINVLQGNMSFVGPRPCLPSQLEVLAERDKAGVTGLLPGISGWAQLAGVDMETPSLLAAVEREYLLHSTFSDDLRVVFATLPGPVQLGRDFEHLRGS